jgi:hypothetical protein
MKRKRGRTGDVRERGARLPHTEVRGSSNAPLGDPQWLDAGHFALQRLRRVPQIPRRAVSQNSGELPKSRPSRSAIPGLTVDDRVATR